MALIIKTQCQVYINVEYLKEPLILNFIKPFTKFFPFIRISHLNVSYLK